MKETNIKYKYLYAWDMMMHSSPLWIKDMQETAANEGAPEDAIYKDVDGNWHRFIDIESETTKLRVQNIVDSMTNNSKCG